MQTLIPPRSYFDPAIFDEERARIFQTTWQCVGVRHDLEQPNDFITSEVGGKPLVVQNFNGELRAFTNVCSHRFNRIQLDERGNRPLRCTYHGWTYDAAGVPVGIPQRPRFEGLTPECIEGLRLQRWDVATCGALIFVRPGYATGPDLPSFLGTAFDAVSAMSAAFGERVAIDTFVAESNWKVMVENTLESYHVDFIHPSTFSKLRLASGTFSWNGPHSSWATTMASDVTAKTAKLEALFSARLWKTPGYVHQLLFPNVTIATTQGLSFSVQWFQPREVDRTRFVTMVFSPKLEAPKMPVSSAREGLGQAVRAFNQTVFEEDRRVCEQVQRGLPHAVGAGMLSEEEERVAAFQRAYLALMKRTL